MTTTTSTPNPTSRFHLPRPFVGLRGITRADLPSQITAGVTLAALMIPLNIVEQITRTFSLIVRLFGNVMSGVFVVGIVLSLAGLYVPIPLMALDLLTGAVQAYIFAVLATVFIGAAAGEMEATQQSPPQKEDISS